MASSEILDVVLIVAAGIILFRLYTVLGRRTGHERQPEENYRFQPNPDAPQQAADDKVAALAPSKRPETIEGRPADPVARGVLDIKLADRSFDAERFLAGARSAYEIVVTAFAKGDRAALKPLLSDEVYHAFDSAIAAREQANESVAFTFVGFKDTKIVEAAMKNRMAEVTAVFGAQFISATSNAAGAVVEGDAKSVREVTDVWTFSRDTRARDPNWMLIATSGELP